MARRIWSTDSVTDSRAGTDVRFGWARVHAGGLSTDSVTDSRAGTDVRFGWESPRGRDSTDFATDERMWVRGGFGQRTLSRTHGREWMSALGWGESTREGEWSMARGFGQRTLSRARGWERMSALGGESPRGRED